MRDPSEVIAEMRRKAIHVADYGMSGMAGKAVIDGWADELSVTLLPASTPPGDACVRHACKRVRMEMQARIDALSEVDDAKVERALKARAGSWSVRDLFQDWDEAPEIMHTALLAAIKGASHAG